MQVSLCRAMRLQSSNNHLLLKASCQVLQDSLHIFFRQNMPRRDDDEEPLPLEIELLLGVGQGFSSCRYTCRIAKSIVARTTGCSKEVQGMASCAGKMLRETSTLGLSVNHGPNCCPPHSSLTSTFWSRVVLARSLAGKHVYFLMKCLIPSTSMRQNCFMNFLWARATT